jgi:hypothetical protein
VAEATHISFPMWQVMRPHDGFFMHYLTFLPCPAKPGLGYLNIRLLKVI